MTAQRLDVFGLEGDIQQDDAEQLPFETASFDTVWSWGVIHHSSSFDRCFAEITRVLRPGGQLILMVYHHPSLFWYLYCLLARGLVKRELRQRSLEDIYLDQMDGAYARRFSRTDSPPSSLATTQWKRSMLWGRRRRCFRFRGRG